MRDYAPLTFDVLRVANVHRLPQFRDRRGNLCHVSTNNNPAGFDWPLSKWSNAVLGELGEAANLIKKIERGDYDLDEVRTELGKELADVVTYLDILAYRAGVDLGMATIDKWNEVSERIGISARFCRGCGQLVDIEVCGCGEGQHPYDDNTGHPFVPIGCDCYRV